jgi:hypothetical protein
MQTRVVNVIGCARCGGDHPLEVRPLDSAGPSVWSHWGLCPVSRQPVFVALEPPKAVNPPRFPLLTGGR